MQDQNTWFLIDQTDLIDSPALLIYPERVRSNITYLIGLIDNINRLRPHIKTHKSRQAVLIMMEAGINKFKCSTIAEAEILGLCEAGDVLLAYQPGGPKINRFFELIRKYKATIYSCLIDNQTTAAVISAEALQQGVKVQVYIDINVGMNRTGIAPVNVLAFYKTVYSLPGLIIKGFHCYDGHINDEAIVLRETKCNLWFNEIENTQRRLVAENYPEPIIIAGGTPTFTVHARRKNIECSPGTFIYWDQSYQNAFKEQLFSPAALVLCRIISLPADDKICLDLGHKSVAAENVISKRVFFLNAPELTVISQSEEHLVMQAAIGHSYKIGDVLYGLPWHICPTVALYERATSIQNGSITGEWLTSARDRKINT